MSPNHNTTYKFPPAAGELCWCEEDFVVIYCRLNINNADKGANNEYSILWKVTVLTIR